MCVPNVLSQMCVPRLLPIPLDLQRHAFHQKHPTKQRPKEQIPLVFFWHCVRMPARKNLPNEDRARERLANASCKTPSHLPSPQADLTQANKNSSRLLFQLPLFLSSRPRSPNHSLRPAVLPPRHEARQIQPAQVAALLTLLFQVLLQFRIQLLAGLPGR